MLKQIRRSRTLTRYLAFGWRLMDTGGVFAYTIDGCLKEEFLQYEMDMAQDEEKQVVFCASGWHCPIERSKNSNECEGCEGHVSRKSVNECWHKCGCNMGCGNRIIQRGITHKLQKFSPMRGRDGGFVHWSNYLPGLLYANT
ncbi:hypothetical protein R1sor_006786 [Riccia sorocarpa]|uniref:Uncharacterized protein n=1 Tax=Riccia sorocarpa TaxID=122646 RepID=A0ABD3HNJ4_9MARC